MQLTELAITNSVPPMPLHTLAVMGAGCVVMDLLSLVTPAAFSMYENQTAETVLIASLVFCLCATLYALLWSHFFRRGPVEALMRMIAD